jgi:hypothetical protein
MLLSLQGPTRLAAFFLLLGALLAGTLPHRPALGQVGTETPLYRALAAMDSPRFNGCDLALTRSLVAADLDFYHDQSGLRDKPQFMAALEQHICASPERKPTRKWGPGSMDLFPLHRDGALYGPLQSGRHEFYVREPGRAPEKTSVARFAHVWIRDGDTGRLAEVVSYDHQSPAE